MRARSARRLAAALLLIHAAAARADWEAGVAAFRAKSWAQAQREFEAAVRERPDWSGGYLMLGRTQLLAGRVVEATATLRKAYDLDPSDLEIRLALAQAYVAGERASEALELLGTVSAAAVPRERQGLYQQLLAQAATESGDVEQARAALEKSAAAQPNDAAVQYQYGVAALNAGRLGAAVAALERSVRLDPQDAVRQRVLVQALVRQGREAKGAAKSASYERAADVARGLVARAPSYDNLLLLGEAQLGAGQYEAAVGSFAQAAGRNAGDWLPHFYAGQAETARALYAEAERALRRALERAAAPADAARVWRQIGFVYEKQRSFEQAKAAYRSAGDPAAAARVAENEKIAADNAAADAQARRLAELEAQQEKLRREIERQGAPPPR